MNINLQRKEYRSDGIFGEITDNNYRFICVTLEHSYDLLPKLPKGKYICKRGLHKLHDGIEFEAFEVMDVPGHSGILFHVGNYNGDSEGCILIGLGIGNAAKGAKMITSSKQAFNLFMQMQVGVDEFELMVE